jgi:endonuclease YncB( thermonuclease family)
MRATCTAGRTNIAAALVEGGHVMADSGLMASYRSELVTAQKARAGIWGGPGTPERPAEWRARLCPVVDLRGFRRLHVVPLRP